MRKSLVVLAMATVGVIAAGGCGKSSNPVSPSGSTMLTVFIRNNAYTPNPITVKAGMSVNWKNEDQVNHNAVSAAFDSGTIPPQSAHSVPATLNQPGTYNYRCTLHGETGSIIVQP